MSKYSLTSQQSQFYKSPKLIQKSTQFAKERRNELRRIKIQDRQQEEQNKYHNMLGVINNIYCNHRHNIFQKKDFALNNDVINKTPFLSSCLYPLSQLSEEDIPKSTMTDVKKLQNQDHLLKQQILEELKEESRIRNQLNCDKVYIRKKKKSHPYPRKTRDTRKPLVQIQEYNNVMKDEDYEFDMPKAYINKIDAAIKDTSNAEKTTSTKIFKNGRFFSPLEEYNLNSVKLKRKQLNNMRITTSNFLKSDFVSHATPKDQLMPIIKNPQTQLDTNLSKLKANQKYANKINNIINKKLNDGPLINSNRSRNLRPIFRLSECKSELNLKSAFITQQHSIVKREKASKEKNVTFQENKNQQIKRDPVKPKLSVSSCTLKKHFNENENITPHSPLSPKSPKNIKRFRVPLKSKSAKFTFADIVHPLNYKSQMISNYINDSKLGKPESELSAKNLSEELRFLEKILKIPNNSRNENVANDFCTNHSNFSQPLFAQTKQNFFPMKTIDAISNQSKQEMAKVTSKIMQLRNKMI